MTFNEFYIWANRAVNDVNELILSQTTNQHALWLPDTNQIYLCNLKRDDINPFKCIVFANSGVKIYDCNENGECDWANPSFRCSGNDRLDPATEEFIKDFRGQGR